MLWGGGIGGVLHLDDDRDHHGRHDGGKGVQRAL